MNSKAGHERSRDFESETSRLTKSQFAAMSIKVFAVEIFFMSLVVAFLFYVLPNLSGGI